MTPEVIEPAPGRGNVVVRLPATGVPAQPGPAGRAGLLLLSHLDVVPAEPEHWDVPPFAAEIKDGFLWGRGTLDTKGLTALEAAILIWAKRHEVPLRKDIVLAATANEESGGSWGAAWLAANRLDLIEAEAALNEGGGIGTRINGKLVYIVQTAEKSPCPVTVRALGQPGHGSMPVENNVVVTLSRALVAIGSRRLPVHITDSYRGFVNGLAASLGGLLGTAAKGLLNPRLADSVIDKLGGLSGNTGALRAMIRNTASPTVVKAGYKTNVIPGEASAEIDCRLLPGFGPADLLAELKTVLAEAGLTGTVELTAGDLSAPAMDSPAGHPLVETIAAAIARHADGAPLVPFMVPGATDGRYLRPKGIPVYGFCPMLPDEQHATAHGHNERVSLAGVRFGAKVLWDIVTAYCG